MFEITICNSTHMYKFAYIGFVYFLLSVPPDFNDGNEPR